MPPKERSRTLIDQQLETCGWLVQDLPPDEHLGWPRDRCPGIRALHRFGERLDIMLEELNEVLAA